MQRGRLLFSKSGRGWLPGGLHLGFPLPPTEEIKIRKGGVRMGFSLWFRVEQKSGSDPSSTYSWELGLGH